MYLHQKFSFNCLTKFMQTEHNKLMLYSTYNNQFIQQNTADKIIHLSTFRNNNE